MSVLSEVKQQILRELKLAIGVSPTHDEIESPRDPSMGDLAFPCFSLAKSMKRNPNELAVEISAKIGPKEFVASVEAAGAYVNFRLNDATLAAAVLEEIQKEGKKYGTNKTGEGTRVMVEYASLNTHKQVHVGHLRNFLVGRMTSDVLKANGYDVIPVAYINDLGANVAKCLWGIKNIFPEEVPEKEERSAFLGKAYKEAIDAVEGKKKAQEEISAISQNLEEGKGEYVDLWKKTREWSLEEMREVYRELGLVFDKWYFESDLIEDTRFIVNDLIKQGIVVSSEGAWIVDLEEEGKGVNLLVKSDGNLLYNAKDLALAKQKEVDYSPARSIYVIDVRQSLAMQQLFLTLQKTGFERELIHLSYEFVTLKEGAMASRKGNIIRYQEFRNAMQMRAREETMARHGDWDEKAIEASSKAIAFAAMKFGMLRQDLEKQIVFDMDEALSFEGFTGPYLLYSYARLSSLLKKAGKQKGKKDVSALKLPEEHALLMALAQYPQVVFETGVSLKLSVIAHYLFDLCKAFSSFYQAVPVLTAEKEELEARLALVEGVKQVLKNGLELMGIESIEEM